MSSHKRTWGGKLGGDHSTVIEAAWLILPNIIKEGSVTRISPGFIKPGKNSTGRRSLKIKNGGGCILLSLRSASAHQEIRVFGKDLVEAKKAISDIATKAGFHVSQ